MGVQLFLFDDRHVPEGECDGNGIPRYVVTWEQCGVIRKGGKPCLDGNYVVRRSGALILGEAEDLVDLLKSAWDSRCVEMKPHGVC